MTMKKLVSIPALLATLALLSGCPSKKPDVPPAPPAPTTDTTGVEDPNATVGDTDATAGPPGELLSKRIVYFDFDRSDIRADSQSIVAAHAAYLAKTPPRRCASKGTPTSVARVNTTSVWVNAAGRQCAAHLRCKAWQRRSCRP